MSSWDDYKTPCPNCGGVVHHWEFGSDDSYSQGSSGIQCRKCNREFSYEEWCLIAKEEMKPETDRIKRKERDRKHKQDRIERMRKRALSKLTPAERESLGLKM